MGEEGRLNLERVRDVLLGSEIYFPFALAQTFWVLHIGDHHLTVVLKCHHLVQWNYFKDSVRGAPGYCASLHRQQCLSPIPCDTSSC